VLIFRFPVILSSFTSPGFNYYWLFVAAGAPATLLITLGLSAILSKRKTILPTEFNTNDFLIIFTSLSFIIINYFLDNTNVTLFYGLIGIIIQYSVAMIVFSIGNNQLNLFQNAIETKKSK